LTPLTGRTLDNAGLVQSGRDRLEQFAAEMLAVLLNRGVSISMRGYASPKGPAGPLGRGLDDPYNLGLSQDRAEAVAPGLADGMELYSPESWTGLDGIKVEGLGELPSREQGGGADPPSTSSRAAFLRWCLANPREVDKWPAWRRVDVEISGFGILRLLD
jgi:outer membrane protein OmpA-like peptidoglycan-associated protein